MANKKHAPLEKPNPTTIVQTQIEIKRKKINNIIKRVYERWKTKKK
jgi:hypothetical protein